MQTGARFLRFAAVGAAGFVVDAGILLLLLSAGMGPYLARVISILAAATFTWWGNRRFTFDVEQKAGAALGREWGGYTAAMAFGGILNYAIYASLITWVELFARIPVLAVMVAVLVTMVVNFVTARWILQGRR